MPSLRLSLRGTLIHYPIIEQVVSQRVRTTHAGYRGTRYVRVCAANFPEFSNEMRRPSCLCHE